MNFEEMQKAWQSHDAGAKITIDSGVLLKEVRRNERSFRATIFWRDVREVGVAILLAAYFSYRGFKTGDWTQWLLAASCLGVGAFMILDRILQRRRKPAPNDSLKACVETSLFHVNHQIWLLKNVVWWYLLPLGAALAVSTGVSMWHSRAATAAVIGLGVYVVFGVLLYRGIYRLNQRAVRASLEPRQQELKTLLATLNENSKL